MDDLQSAVAQYEEMANGSQICPFYLSGNNVVFLALYNTADAATRSRAEASLASIMNSPNFMAQAKAVFQYAG
jgi:hypothetical protein